MLGIFLRLHAYSIKEQLLTGFNIIWHILCYYVVKYANWQNAPLQTAKILYNKFKS